MHDLSGHVRVLHVDDEVDVADLTATFLERDERFSVDIATSASEGLDRLAAESIDCVVSDYEMPEMDGIEFLETVRDEYPDLPFILFTGQGNEEIASEAISAGVTDYLQKQTGSEQYDLLANRIRNAVSQYRAANRATNLDRIHRVYSGVNQAVMEAETRAEIERRVCERLSESDPYRFAWIGAADDDGQRIEPRASAGVESGYLDAIEITVDGDDPTGPTARAYRTRELAVLQDIPADPAYEQWRADAIERGYQSSAAIPLRHGETLYGVLNVYADRTNAFDERERALLAELGDTVGHAIRRVELRTDLERRLRRFESAVEHAGHVVLITDTDATIRYVNGAFESVTGYAASEAVGRTPAMLQSGEHDGEFYQDLWETILAGDVWQGEVINERKSGERYVVDQTIAPITDGDGGITGFVAINRDVSERKQREQNLTFLKRAIDQAGIGIATHNADGYPTYVNQHLGSLLGTDRASLRDAHMTDHTPELDRDQFETYWDSYDDGERRVYDTRLERTDTGETIPVEIIGSKITIGGEAYQVSTVRDITDRKQRTQDLRRFRSAVEHAGHGVLITDVDGTIEYVNDAFETISGYTAAEAVGETPALLKSGAHDQAFYRALWETVLAGDVWQGEVVNERKGGERYVIDQTIAPITDSDGETTGFVAINRDITDIKQYERELEAQNERLKQYGQTVAHDLRNPLTPLYAEVDRLRALMDDDEVDAESVRERCDSIDEIVRRMEALIDDLLTMAEQGQLVLHPEAVSLEEVATAAWAQIETPNASLDVDSTPIQADHDRVIEMLSNLFRNAIEHGGDAVHVRIGPLDFEEGFFVADDGPGIPAAERERVLDRGYTTDESGTGFGLAIVDQIADAHGWSVSVTEGRTGGARFEFRTGED
ncbi:PAS domain S-box protein [Haloarcula salina]|uniref:PAS domain S-box protein n=1 Tax=Haloarcula salina TaxID=1429914 RepID=A0AA41G1U8_9EURY|nr:PAS domain S-box protein [Haloarcula salina]MBV0902855.1 PAS domain S-box protein [Haloarcula salina]